MDFVLLLFINLAVLALMYLALRYLLQQQYNSKRFLSVFQKEVNAVMTDLNQATESNVQILNVEIDRLQSIRKKAEKRIAEMQHILTQFDRPDGRYNEIIMKKFSNNPIPRIDQSKEQYGTQEDGAMNKVEFNQEITREERVLGLYNQGRTMQEIAGLVHLPLGEVELIIEFSRD